MNVNNTKNDRNSGSELPPPTPTRRGKELLDQIPSTAYSSNWEKQRRDRTQRQRIARAIWGLLLIAALIAAVITGLRSH